MKKINAILLIVTLLAATLSFASNAATGSPNQATAVYATTAPEIDGKIDDIWLNSTAVLINGKDNNYKQWGFTADTDETVSVKFIWDSTYLYVLIDVNAPDGVQVTDSKAAYQNDGVVIYIDEDNTVKYSETSSVVYGDYTVYYFDMVADGSFYGTDNTVSAAALKKFKFATVVTDKGYTIEEAIPWEKITPAVGSVVGMDIEAEVNLGNGSRECQLNWSDTSANAFRLLDGFGELTLAKGFAVKAVETKAEVAAETTATATTTTAAAQTSDSFFLPCAVVIVALAAVIAVSRKKVK